jgi:hypothetical protein
MPVDIVIDPGSYASHAIYSLHIFHHVQEKR